MNAVEIEEAISALAEQPFDPAEFPYAFLEAFGNKETTLRRLHKGESNKSDLGGVLQTNNIHIATCKAGDVTRTLEALKASPATARAKARFVLATDGDLFEAEDLTTDDAPVSLPSTSRTGRTCRDWMRPRRAMDAASSSIETPDFTRRTFAWLSTSLLKGMSRDDDRVIFWMAVAMFVTPRRTPRASLST